MKELIIVDGYNVINQESRYRQLMDDLETSRVKLVEDLANFSMVMGCDVVVVFDAFVSQENFNRKANILGVNVFFTRRGQTADSLIEKFVYEAKPDKRVMVVTADYNQQKTIFREGVLRKTPKEMVNDILEAKNQSSKMKRIKSKRIFLEDRLDEKVRESLRRLTRNP